MKDKNNEKYKVFLNILDIFKESAFFLLFAITLILVITNLLFVFDITITRFHLPIIYILAIIIYLIFKKKKLKEALISILVTTLIFSFSIFIVGKIYDNTSDGNTYHKLAVGALKNGWNPLYQGVEDFNIDEGNPFDIYEDNVNITWVNHYARGTETFGAVIYAFTNNIETGKVFNLLFVYISFFILYGILRKMKLSLFKSLLIAIVMALNPIILVQLSNYYLDGVLALSLFIIILCCLRQFEKISKEERKYNYLILAFSIIWCVNAKFTGLAFAGVFCLLYYLIKHIRNFIKDKDNFKKILIKDTIFYIVTVFIAVIIVGGSTYTKNFIEYGHPLYPLYGEGHVDNMVMMEIPKSLQDEDSLTIFLTSLFAKGVNVSPSYSDENIEPELKIPFTTTKEEISNYSIPDIRMAGFGPLFSGVFILAVIGTVLIIIDYIRKKDINRLISYILTLILIFLLILLLDGSYWARYIPYLYLVPVFVLINFLGKDFKRHKFVNIFAFVMAFILLVNSALILKTQLSSVLYTNSYISVNLEAFCDYANDNDTVLVNLSHHGIQGVLYNLDDLGITNYELTDTVLENDGYMFTY